jgi:hypothetical protein
MTFLSVRSRSTYKISPKSFHLITNDNFELKWFCQQWQSTNGFPTWKFIFNLVHDESLRTHFFFTSNNKNAEILPKIINLVHDESVRTLLFSTSNNKNVEILSKIICGLNFKIILIVSMRDKLRCIYNILHFVGLIKYQCMRYHDSSYFQLM